MDACRYYGGLLVGAVQGADKATLLSSGYCPVDGLWEDGPLSTAIAEIAHGSFKRREPPQIVGSGYVVKSLEAALWAFHKTDNFRDGALLAANLGNDADTTAAIYRPTRGRPLRRRRHPGRVAQQAGHGRGDHHLGGRAVRAIWVGCVGERRRLYPSKPLYSNCKPWPSGSSK